jgi:CRP-like cAMP-binding protein
MAAHAKTVVRPPVAARPQNKLLASLPQADFGRMKVHLRTVPLKPRQVFHRINERIEQVVFLNGGVASITAIMQNGTLIETATVGREGFIGIEAFFGGELATGETMLLVPDTDAEIMTAKAFREELNRRGALFAAVQRYSQGLMLQIMQSVACIATHPVQERCCRWLLMTHDRVQGDDFHLSHEFLATMLGSTRQTVNVVARTLHNAGLISYKYGHITVLDREGLEAASCECYATVQAQFKRLGL